MLKSYHCHIIRFVPDVWRLYKVLPRWNCHWKMLKFQTIRKPRDLVYQLEIPGYIQKIIQSASTSITQLNQLYIRTPWFVYLLVRKAFIINNINCIRLIYFIIYVTDFYFWFYYRFRKDFHRRCCDVQFLEMVSIWKDCVFSTDKTSCCSAN